MTIEPTDDEVLTAAREMQWNGDAEWIRRAASHGDFGCSRVMALAHALAKLRIAGAALEPFASWAAGEVDAEGWKTPPMRERVADWFGPTDFRKAVEAYTQITGEIATIS